MKAFLFAGQGAQTVGMAKETVGLEKVDRLLKLAEKFLPGIAEMMFCGEQEQLNLTINTQPAMFLADLMYAYKAEEQSGAPQAVCGFSVGEIPALCYAGALDLETGMKLIAARAALMDKAAALHEGGMVAVVGLSKEKVEEIAAAVKNCWAVNYNAPLQTVVAAAKNSVQALCALIAQEKGRAIPLKVSGAFHCPFMESASEGLKRFMDDIDFKGPQIPVYANLTARLYCGSAREMKELLYRQVCSPVRFVDTVMNMKEAGIDEFVEVGPGTVLSGLVKKIGEVKKC